MTSRRRHLAIMWLSQFLSIAGFNFAMPFAPHHIPLLGVTDPVALRM